MRDSEARIPGIDFPTNGTSRQREVPELVYLLEAGASHAQVVNYTTKILDWAVQTVAATPRQTHVEGYAIEEATRRLLNGKQELLDSVGLGYPPKAVDGP